MFCVIDKYKKLDILYCMNMMNESEAEALLLDFLLESERIQAMTPKDFLIYLDDLLSAIVGEVDCDEIQDTSSIIERVKTLLQYSDEVMYIIDFALTYYTLLYGFSFSFLNKVLAPNEKKMLEKLCGADLNQLFLNVITRNIDEDDHIKLIDKQVDKHIAAVRRRLKNLNLKITYEHITSDVTSDVVCIKLKKQEV